MLIDAVYSKEPDSIIDYLEKEGVTSIDYIVATHPHADHINTMDDIIEKIDIGKIYIPQVQNNTRVFENLLLSIKKKRLDISRPVK